MRVAVFSLSAENFLQTVLSNAPKTALDYQVGMSLPWLDTKQEQIISISNR